MPEIFFDESYFIRMIDEERLLAEAVLSLGMANQDDYICPSILRD